MIYDLVWGYVNVSMMVLLFPSVLPIIKSIILILYYTHRNNFKFSLPRPLQQSQTTESNPEYVFSFQPDQQSFQCHAVTMLTIIYFSLQRYCEMNTSRHTIRLVLSLKFPIFIKSIIFLIENLKTISIHLLTKFFSAPLANQRSSINFCKSPRLFGRRF